MGNAVISVENVSKLFNGRAALDGCSLSVARGSIYGLVGKNGAGKTTLLKILLGLQRPTAGRTQIFGMDVVTNRVVILKETGSMIETPIFYEHLSAHENLRLHLAYMGLPAAGIERALAQVGLAAVNEQPVRVFSLGMRQRLALARAIVHRPSLLILDEPTNALDPVGVRDVGALLCTLAAQEGTTVLLSSHLLYEMEAVADVIGVMRQGRIVAEWTRPSFAKKPAPEVADELVAMMEGGRDDGLVDAFRS